MSKAKQLYDLQELDIELDAKRQALLNVVSSIGESNTLLEARDLLALEQKKLVEAESLMKGLETDAEDTRAKAASAGEKLYGGAVKNPKELVSLKEQVETYNRKVKEIEDRTLEVMSDVESLKGSVAFKRRALSTIEEQWRKEQEQLLQEREDLEASIAGMEAKRNTEVAGIEPAALKLYENLRGRRQGRAVARAEQGMCQGCRIVLPMNKLQQIKTGHTLVQCGSCERILYLS